MYFLPVLVVEHAAHVFIRVIIVVDNMVVTVLLGESNFGILLLK